MCDSTYINELNKPIRLESLMGKKKKERTSPICSFSESDIGVGGHEDTSLEV